MKSPEPYKLKPDGVDWHIRPLDFELKAYERKCQPPGIYLEPFKNQSSWNKKLRQ